MANRTVKDAHSVRGTNPQYLVEKIIRSRIYECRYWKEDCFALSAELLVDKAMGLKYIGGVFSGNIKPTPFICLILKMLQIQPEKDIVIEFITQPDFKYVRALGAVYMRLVGTSLDCFKYLEPLYLDYRKLKRINRQGGFELLHVDEFIDELLREERICDIILPRIQKRHVLEESNQLESRASALDDDLEEMEPSDEEEMLDLKEKEKVEPPAEKTDTRQWERARPSSPPKHRRRRSRSRERDRGRDREHNRERERDRERHRSRSRERHRERRRSRSRSRDKDRHKSGHKHRHEQDEEERHHRHKSKKSRDHKRSSDHKESHYSKEELSIKEANELRAKLGIQPLRP